MSKSKSINLSDAFVDYVLRFALFVIYALLGAFGVMIAFEALHEDWLAVPGISYGSSVSITVGLMLLVQSIYWLITESNK